MHHSSWGGGGYKPPNFLHCFYCHCFKEIVSSSKRCKHLYFHNILSPILPRRTQFPLPYTSSTPKWRKETTIPRWRKTVREDLSEEGTWDKVVTECPKLAHIPYHSWYRNSLYETCRHRPRADIFHPKQLFKTCASRWGHTGHWLQNRNLLAILC